MSVDAAVNAAVKESYKTIETVVLINNPDRFNILQNVFKNQTVACKTLITGDLLHDNDGKIQEQKPIYLPKNLRMLIVKIPAVRKDQIRQYSFHCRDLADALFAQPLQEPPRMLREFVVENWVIRGDTFTKLIPTVCVNCIVEVSFLEQVLKCAFADKKHRPPVFIAPINYDEQNHIYVAYMEIIQLLHNYFNRKTMLEQNHAMYKRFLSHEDRLENRLENNRLENRLEDDRKNNELLFSILEKRYNNPLF